MWSAFEFLGEQIDNGFACPTILNLNQKKKEKTQQQK